MSDEPNRSDGQQQPESRREAANTIERSDDPARPGASLGASANAVTNGDATNQESPQENEILPSSESSSNPNSPLPPTAEASSGPSNDNRPEGQDERIQDRSDSTQELRKIEPTPPTADTNGLQKEANPSVQPTLDDPEDPFLATLTEDDLRALEAYEERLARGGPHLSDKSEAADTPPFEPSPSIDLARYEDCYKNKVVGVSLFSWLQSKEKVTCSPVREFEGRQYHVPQLPPGLYESMPLPDGTCGYGSTRQLFDSIHRLLHGYLMLLEKPSALLAYWCIATWFPDVLDFVPRLTITGPRYAADLLFRMLRCACRRPLLLAGLSPAVLKLIPIRELMPTLFIYETRRSKRTEELLDAGDHRGYFVASGGKMHQCYCARCVYLGEDYIPAQSAQEGIHIHVSRDTSLPDRPLPRDTEIQILQNQLFLYRSFNRDLVASCKYRPSGLLPELSAVAKQLGAAIVHDTDLRQRVVELLKEQNEQAHVDRSREVKGTVLRAVLWHCHQGDEKVHTSKIAETVNARYREEGESLRVSSETVGHVLKNLGLYSIRLGSAGRGLRLDKAMRLRAHELSLAYGVLPGVPECGHCHTFQVSQSEEVM
jgi:hypothetical protein